MYTFKQYKKIYKDTTFKRYMWNYVLYMPKKWCRIPYYVYMCIRYPFLYPRNRFTDKHYNNWKVLNFAQNIHNKYSHVKFKLGEPLSELEISSFKNLYPYHVEQPSDEMIKGWINWWAKPVWKMIIFFHDYILGLIHCLPTHIEWDSVEPGWKKAFGKQYLKDLKKQLKKDKMLYSWRITDIKEKWGTFHLYCNYGSKELYELINRYEDLSWETCIVCGKHATHQSTSWILPYCEECANKNSNPYNPVIKKDEYDDHMKNI